MGAPKRIMIRHYEYRKSRIFFKSVTDPKIYEPVSKRRRMKIWDENKKKSFAKNLSLTDMSFGVTFIQ